MKHENRRILCMSVVALLLISIVGTGVAVSQQAQKGNAKAMAAGVVAEEMSQNGEMNVPIRAIHSGHGFALSNDGDFHVLRVNILTVGHIPPGEIRGLMGENKSISEIRAEIEEKSGAPFYRGHMRLGENHYRLVNISVTETVDGGDRTFEADVVGPLWSTETSESINTVGHISVTVMPYEGVRIGDGTLNMYDSGDYRALLDVLSPRPWRL
ncbi:MAG TPA: hypothetical protein VMW40_08545 [Candidatus Bathyarchaeia archaeon]|nr:hypothetical protein [Candidatus Bathyarchaeia archaeon]